MKNREIKIFGKLINCKVLLVMNIMIVITEKVPTNFVPAVAVRRGGRALFIIIGRKGQVDGIVELNMKGQMQMC